MASAPALGAGCRGFKSLHLDQIRMLILIRQISKSAFFLSIANFKEGQMKYYKKLTGEHLYLSPVNSDEVDIYAWAGKNLPKATGFARAGIAGYNGQYNDTIGVKKRPRDCLLYSQ